MSIPGGPWQSEVLQHVVVDLGGDLFFLYDFLNGLDGSGIARAAAFLLLFRCHRRFASSLLDFTSLKI